MNNDADPGIHIITQLDYAEIDIKTRRHAKLKGALTRFEKLYLGAVSLAAIAFLGSIAWRAFT